MSELCGVCDRVCLYRHSAFGVLAVALSAQLISLMSSLMEDLQLENLSPGVRSNQQNDSSHSVQQRLYVISAV